jgi:hypothetical protein
LLERINEEIKEHIYMLAIYPNHAAIKRLVGADLWRMSSADS